MAVTLVALVVVPGSSSAAESAPALSGVLPGSGYVAVKVEWSGVGDVELKLEANLTRQENAMGVAYVRPDGSTWSIIMMGVPRFGSEDCLIVRTDATGRIEGACGPSTVQNVVFGSPHGRVDSIAISLSEEDGDPPGVWTLVVWQAYRPAYETSGRWRLSFAPGEGEVLGVTTGDRAFAATPADFDGGHTASASLAGAFASAHAGSRIAFDVQGALLGTMRPDTLFGNSPGMTLHGPLGSQTCRCTFFSPVPSPEAPPGHYVVELNRVAGGHQTVTEAFVVVVDLELPA